MKSLDDSKRLAEALVRTGNEFHVRTQAVVSDMSQPLGKFAGNALEVYECVRILRNETEDSMSATRELSLELSARMLLLADSVPDIASARAAVEARLLDGSALECFKQNIELQGGDPSVCDEPSKLLTDSLFECRVDSDSDGIVTEIDTFKIGSAMVDIGGGRVKAEDSVDPAVGFCCLAKIGTAIKQGEALGIAYCRNEHQAEKVRAKLNSAFRVSSDLPVVKPKLIQAVIGE
jgi:pyrimidine-nucleoside phosphorylase